MFPRSFLILGLFLLSSCVTYNEQMEDINKSIKETSTKRTLIYINRLNADQAVVFARLQVKIDDVKKDFCHINLKAVEKIDWLGIFTGPRISLNTLTPLSDKDMFAGIITPGNYQLTIYCDSEFKLLMKTDNFIDTNIFVKIPSAQTAYYIGDIKLSTKTNNSYTGIITSLEITDKMRDAQTEFNRLLPTPKVKALPMHKQLAIVANRR